MRKERIKDLIERGMLYQGKSDRVNAYKAKADIYFKEALRELDKTDWVSVEDDLPPFQEAVLACNQNDPEDVFFCHRSDCEKVDKDKYGFCNYLHAPITHWRKIEYLHL